MRACRVPAGPRDQRLLLRLPSGPVLNDAQRRALGAGLRQIETELAAIEQLLHETYQGVMVSFEDDVAASKGARLEHGIAEARQLLRELQATLGLAPERISKRRWIGGHLLLLAVVAEECQSRHLRGYGNVGPELAAWLDPRAGRLAELLLAMQDPTGKREACPREPT